MDCQQTGLADRSDRYLSTNTRPEVPSSTGGLSCILSEGSSRQ
jgi:hypothetical protein